LHLRVVLACSAHEPAPRAYTPRDPTGTALYRLVADQRATFAKVTAEQGNVPSFVNEGFERFLRCGVLACGFARYQCSDCRHDHLVPLSCKARGLCPSCGGRRMMTLTRHVMDAVLPYVPTRQWVLTLPHALRYRVAYDQPLCTAIHRALAGALRKRLRRLARAHGHAGAETGSVTWVQRWGSGLNLNPHYHVISLDGWFQRAADGLLSFTPAPAPTQQQVEALLLDVHARVYRVLARRGLLEADAEDALACDAPALSACYDGAVTQRVGLGPMRGRPVIKLGVPLSRHLATAQERVERAGRLCARVDGFDLHGRVAFGAADRARLEELVRYCARPPLAYDRLSKQADGRYMLRLKTRWRDGTSHLLFEPIELMERLAAQIPKPRVNLVLYAGVLAPHAKLRADAVAHARHEPLPEPPATETQTRAERDSWSELMRATFGLDVLECPRCGGRLKYMATILDSRVARRILTHLGRPARAPPAAPARDPVPFWDAVDAETWH
jgi:DNA-directed RNA polymerase subunit RPC12/RpoP